MQKRIENWLCLPEHRFFQGDFSETFYLLTRDRCICRHSFNDQLLYTMAR